MSKDLRWRIIALQIVVTLVFAFSAGVCFWAHNFTQDEVHNQLVQQNIVFPAANSGAIKALPAADASEVAQYAGQQLTNGYQARAYAEHFIAVHLKDMGGTYSYFSGKAMAEQKTNPTQYAVDNNMALTIFRGDTLRTMLNQAWAFWFVGDIAFFAAIGLTVGAVVVFLSLLFEVFFAPKMVTPLGLARAA